MSTIDEGKRDATALAVREQEAAPLGHPLSRPTPVQVDRR
jgi:hypothetical protein